MNQRTMRIVSTRRAFASAALLAAVACEATPAVNLARTLAPPSAVAGVCRREAGIQLLLDWNEGTTDVLPRETVPPASWVLYRHPTDPLVFRYPPDWTPLALWAEGLSASGTPVWTDQPLQVPVLTAARIVSPGKDAAWELVSGAVTNLLLTPDDGATVASRGLLGEGVKLASVCTAEAGKLPGWWFHGSRVGRSVLVTMGSALRETSGLYPMTILAYYSMYGPEKQFAHLARTVFIPILAQMTGGGGPTPVPTEAP